MNRDCNKCGKTLPLTKEYFYSRDNGKYFKSECKDCSRNLSNSVNKTNRTLAKNIGKVLPQSTANTITLPEEEMNLLRELALFNDYDSVEKAIRSLIRSAHKKMMNKRSTAAE